MYSMIRSTVASNRSRAMFDEKLVSDEARAVPSEAGTGSRRRRLTSSIVSTARPYASSTSAPSPTNACASTVSSCLRWSNASSESVIISAMSGSPSGSGFGAPSGSTVRTRS
jgi:hypothetical protein